MILDRIGYLAKLYGLPIRAGGRVLLDTGKRSAADINGAELSALLDDLRKLATGKRSGRSYHHGRPSMLWRKDLKPEEQNKLSIMRSIEAHLAVHKRPWAYVHAMAERMFGVKRIEWLKPSDLNKVNIALIYDARRRAKRAEKGGRNAD